MRAWVSERLTRITWRLAGLGMGLAILATVLMAMFGHLLAAVRDLLIVAMIAGFLLWALYLPLNRKGKGGFKA